MPDAVNLNQVKDLFKIMKQTYNCLVQEVLAFVEDAKEPFLL